jgi:pimeloyl-ACP methyl ester carboxylesterase
MSRTGHSLPVKHRSTFDYSGKEIPFYFWSNDNQDIPPDAVIFLGTGQVARITKWVASGAPPGVVVVGGLPHWHSDPSAKDLVAFSNAYTKCAYETALRTFGASSMHVIGESQAAPSTIWLANHLREKIDNVALVLPMGLNTRHFGATDGERFRELRKRSLRTLLQIGQSPFHDLRNIYISALLAKIILLGVRDSSTTKKYTMGISQDMLEDFRTLLEDWRGLQRTVTLFVGDEDRIFVASEIMQSLKKASINNVHLEVVAHTSHSSLAIRSSQPLLKRAVAGVRQRA